MQRRLPRSERRQQLIDVATMKFGERGFHPTSMDDIAAAAGITKPVLYQHFSSKEDLYIAVIASIGEELEKRIVAFADMDTSTRDRIGAGIEMFFDMMSSQASTLRLFFGSEFVTDRVNEEVSRVVSKAARSVGTVVEGTRSLSPEDALVIGNSLVASVQAAAKQTVGASDKERERVLATLTKLLTDGIRAFRPTDE